MREDEIAYQKVKLLVAFVALCKSKEEVDLDLGITKLLWCYDKLPESKQ